MMPTSKGATTAGALVMRFPPSAQPQPCCSGHQPEIDRALAGISSPFEVEEILLSPVAELAALPRRHVGGLDALEQDEQRAEVVEVALEGIEQALSLEGHRVPRAVEDELA